VAADAVGAARAPERIELVDEDDRRRLLPCLLEEIAHACRADADEHLDELGAGDGEERHAGLAGDRAGEEGLPRSRRPDQQHAFRHTCAEAAVFLRVLEELHDFAQLGFRLVHAGDVGECHAGLVLDIDLGAALPDRHEPAAEALLPGHAADQPEPDAEEHQRRHHPGKDIAQERALLHARVLHLELRQPLGHLGLHHVGDDDFLAVFLRRLEFARDAAVAHDDFLDAVFGQQPLELAVRHDFDRLRLLPPLLQQQDGEDGEEDVADIELGAPFHDQWEMGTSYIWARLNVGSKPPSAQ
jgi:hypothetical protein